MAKRRKASKRRASSKRRVTRRRSTPRSRSSRSDDKSGMYVAALIAVVAVVGLVLLYHDSNAMGNATFEVNPGGSSEVYSIGWDLGEQVGQMWDGTETRKYCSLACGDACARAVNPQGTEQQNCYRSCRQNCETQIMQGNYLTDPNAAGRGY